MTIMTTVNRMLQDVSQKYQTQVGINQSNRTGDQAQQFHVCHMYLYNYFHSRCPKYCDAGKRTISWSHISDAAIKWALIDGLKSTFLRTSTGAPAVLNPGTSQWVDSPDEQRSTHAMSQFLKDHKVSSMAAPGVDGCGEPCGCNGHASKHITGEACDLHGLEQLGHEILKADPAKYHDSTAAVYDFLHGYGLWPPLAHLTGKAQELWHVEAIPHHLAHHKAKHSMAHHVKHHHPGC